MNPTTPDRRHHLPPRRHPSRSLRPVEMECCKLGCVGSASPQCPPSWPFQSYRSGYHLMASQDGQHLDIHGGSKASKGWSGGRPGQVYMDLLEQRSKGAEEHVALVIRVYITKWEKNIQFFAGSNHRADVHCCNGNVAETANPTRTPPFVSTDRLFRSHISYRAVDIACCT